MSSQPHAIVPRHTDAAPAAIGPYSQSVSIDSLLFTSGQVGLDPQTGELVPGGFEPQAHQVFANLTAVLASAGCGWNDVVKAVVFLADMSDFPTLNRIYAETMGAHKPARSTVQVAGLPKGARAEVELVARIP